MGCTVAPDGVTSPGARLKEPEPGKCGAWSKAAVRPGPSHSAPAQLGLKTCMKSGEWRVESGESPLTRCHDTRHITPVITSLTDTAPATPPCLCHDPWLTMTITTDYDCQPQFSALGLDPELPRQSSSDWSGLRQAGL